MCLEKSEPENMGMEKRKEDCEGELNTVHLIRNLVYYKKWHIGKCVTEIFVSLEY